MKSTVVMIVVVAVVALTAACGQDSLNVAGPSSVVRPPAVQKGSTIAILDKTPRP